MDHLKRADENRVRAVLAALQDHENNVDRTVRGILGFDPAATGPSSSLFQSARLKIDDRDYRDPMSHPWIFSAVRKLATYHSEGVLTVKLERADKSLEDAPINHPLVELFDDDEINPTMTQADLWEAWQTHMKLDGEEFWLLWNEDLEPVEEGETPSVIWPVRGRRNVEEKIVGGRLEGWKVHNMKRTYHPHQVLVFKFFHPDNPFRGLDPTTAYERAATTDLKSVAWNEALLDNGADVGGVIILENPGYSRREIEQMQDTFEERHGGATNRGRPAVIANAKYQETGKAPREMDFVEGQNLNLRKYQAIFGVTPFDLNQTEDVNRAVAEAFKRKTYEDTVIPDMKRICRCLKKWARQLTGERVVFEFDLSKIECLKANLGEKILQTKDLQDLGYPLDVAAEKTELGMEELEDDLGKVPLVRVGLQKLTDLTDDIDLDFDGLLGDLTDGDGGDDPPPEDEEGSEGGGGDGEGDGDVEGPNSSSSEGDDSSGSSPSEAEGSKSLSPPNVPRWKEIDGAVVTANVLRQVSIPGEKAMKSKLRTHFRRIRTDVFRRLETVVGKAGSSSKIASCLPREVVGKISEVSELVRNLGEVALTPEEYLGYPLGFTLERFPSKSVARFCPGCDGFYLPRSRRLALAGLNGSSLGRLEELLRELTHDTVDDVLFANLQFNEELRAKLGSVYRFTLLKSAQQVSAELGGLSVFSVGSPEAIAFVQKKVIKVVGINRTLRDAIRNSLVQSVSLAETVEETKVRLRKVFNTSASRAKRIARTETAQTNSGTRFLAFRKEGIERHEWLPVRDANTRPTHVTEWPEVSPDGIGVAFQVVEVGVEFANGLRHPSDPNSGIAREVVNCRCVARATEKEVS